MPSPLTPGSTVAIEWAIPWYTGPMRDHPGHPDPLALPDLPAAPAAPALPGQDRVVRPSPPAAPAAGGGRLPAEPARGALLDAAAFEGLRRYLFAVAYRMLGSASEAEDIVQDAYLRARDVRVDEIQSLKAYLATVVTRLCLDHLRSARVQREVYVGPWLPEPVPTADLVTLPAQAAEQADEISLAFLVLLERLTPEERATYVLREAFAYPYDEIAAVLGKSSAAVRQLSHRAKERVAAERPRFQASPETQRALAERFLAASRAGDLGALTTMLAADATSWGDGGAAIGAARRPIVGRDAVARLIARGMEKWLKDTSATFALVNGGIATLLWRGGRLQSVVTFEADAERIHGIRTVVNPVKLAYLERRLGEMDATAAHPAS